MKKLSKDARLCIPGEKTWEVWKLGSGDHWVRQSETAESPAALSNIEVFAFPVSGVTSHPFWAVSEDESLLDDMVSIRLETQSLMPNAPKGKHWEHRMLETDGARFLVMATVLEDGRPVELPKGDAEVFEVTPNLYPLPRNHVVLWKELDRWVVCVTRNGSPVYFQALTVGELDEAAVLELRCLLLPLQGQGLTDRLSGIVVWDQTTGAETMDTLAKGLELPVALEDRPAPLLPEKPLELLPQLVAENREAAERRRRIRNIITLAALAYLAVAGYFFYQIFDAKKKLAVLREENKMLNKQVGWIGPTQQRWDGLEVAIDAKRYPVEIVNRVLSKKPAKGLRLTRVDVNPKTITVQGQATNPSLARNFCNGLKKIEGLREDYEWKAPELSINPDGTAVFTVKAKHLYSMQEGFNS